MTIAALRALLDAEQPCVRRHPAPLIPHTARRRNKMTTTSASGSAAPDTPGTTPDPAPAAPSVDDLLAWAEQHADTAIQRTGTAARDALATLASRHHADNRLARLDARAAQLEAELAQINRARAGLRPRARRGGSTRDYDPAAVRTWAAENGLPVPERGRVPSGVLAAWRARPGARS